MYARGACEILKEIAENLKRRAIGERGRGDAAKTAKSQRRLYILIYGRARGRARDFKSGHGPRYCPQAGGRSPGDYAKAMGHLFNQCEGCADAGRLYSCYCPPTGRDDFSNLLDRWIEAGIAVGKLIARI